MDDESPTTPFVGAGARPGLNLSAGDVLSGRYRIVGFLAHGGMGDVYEAEDLELGERVALKTLRAGTLGDETTLARFKREILLARKVTHGNVCRIFDLGFHALENETVSFLTMELLAGESLSARLRRGRIPPPEALPLVSQIVQGLAAAHRAGVAHRDLKPGNIMLAPSAEGTRVVVTDFGLARSLLPEEGRDLTGAGFAMGTAEYMAPEQLEGESAGPAADIYALGVVIFEMVTGKLPFAAETALATAVKRLKEPPPAPRLLAPEIPPHWDRAILRCLERDPSRRFAKVEDVARALAGAAVPTSSRRSALLLAALGAALLVVVFLAYRFVPRARTPAPAASTSVKARRSVAVLGFKNLSGRDDTAWLSTALAEMLTTELAAGESIRAVPGEAVARMKLDLALADTDSFARDTLARIRQHIGSDIVILGSYLAIRSAEETRLRLDLRAQDTQAGETIASVAETGTESDLFGLVAAAGASLRTKLGLQPLSADEGAAFQASVITKSECARLYSQGLARLRLFDVLGARAFLERAVETEPGYAPAHAALAEAWLALGYEEKATTEAKKAFDLSAGLSREERLSIEGRYREATREWDKAVEIYRTLWGFFPDNLDYGIRLANMQSRASRGNDALATVDALHRLPAPDREDPRTDLAEARAAQSLSDFTRARRAATTAIERGTARGARLLVARAKVVHGSALAAMGDSQAGTAALEEARRIFAEAGDQAGAADAINQVGLLLWQQGDLEQARARFEETLSVARAIGSKTAEARAMNNLAILAQAQGDIGASRRAFEAVLAISRQTGNLIVTATALNNIGTVFHREAKLGEALARYQESLSVARRIGRKEGIALALSNIAWVRRLQGDLGEARKRYEEAVEVAEEARARSVAAISHFGLGETLVEMGDLAAARRHHEESLAVRNEIGEKGPAAASRVALAEIDLEEERHTAAEPAARAAAEEFRRERAHELEAPALALLARCLLAKGDTAGARATSALATEAATRSHRRDVQLRAAITASQIAASESSQQARKLLEATLADAARAGLVGLELEARLALGEIELSAGGGAGRSRLQALRNEAQSKGFGLIVRKSARLLGDR